MEDCVVVVAVETELEEVPAGERDLLRPELEGDVAGGGVEDAGGGGLRFEIVEGGHFGGGWEDLQVNEALEKFVLGERWVW